MICLGLEPDDFAVSAWKKNDANFLTYMGVVGRGGTARVKSQVDVPIDEEFATAIQRAWATMLLRSRYPENEYHGADGWDVEFSVRVGGLGTIYGKAWSPSTGLVRGLMDLGLALVDYCKAQESDRSRKRRELLGRLEDFEKRVTATK